jgi:uncharacterized membrane protein YqgA involved in biofilm formation
VFPGVGTLVNIGTVLVGTVLGVLVGHRLTQRTRDVVTDGLGLVTLLIAAVSAAEITDASWSSAVGTSAPMLIVLGSLLVGGIAGSVLGSINDGLGNGADQLFLKSALDGFAAIAFAASLGWGVAFSALAILLVQGSLTLIGAGLGDILPAPHLVALTTTGGLLLVGVALTSAAPQAAPRR